VIRIAASSSHKPETRRLLISSSARRRFCNIAQKQLVFATTTNHKTTEKPTSYGMIKPTNATKICFIHTLNP